MQPTTMQSLLRFALGLPETEESVACAGTAVESRTVKRKNKAFLFLRASDARLKLAASVKEAARLAAQEPTRYSVGKLGWVLVRLDGASDRVDLLKRWIEESYSLFGTGKAKSTKANAASPTSKKKAGKAK